MSLRKAYERNNFLAGKFDRTTNADWAPIYLSQQLMNTEYGSLLNITDQVLKSWSLNGTVRYENFNYAHALYLRTPRGEVKADYLGVHDHLILESAGFSPLLMLGDREDVEPKNPDTFLELIEKEA